MNSSNLFININYLKWKETITFKNTTNFNANSLFLEKMKLYVKNRFDESFQ